MIGSHMPLHDTPIHALPTQRPVRIQSRRGLSQVEVLVAATLVMAGMGVLPTLGFQINRIAKDSRHYQLAVHELANQLERLTSLPPDQLQIAIEELQLADDVSESLPGAKLDATIVADAHGTRLVLSLQWDRNGSPPPLQLVGWIDTEPVPIAEPDSNDEGDAS